MFSSEIIGVFSIVVSASFGLWGVTLALRKRKYPGEISFIEDRSIRLFDEIVDNIGALSVNYKGAAIDNNIILFKGHLINSGSKDISHEMVDAPLTAYLPNGFKWLEANIVSCSDKLRATVQIESKEKLKFDLGLFKCGEYITFEALLEINDADIKESSEVLTWNHRITDTSRIKKDYIPDELPRVNSLQTVLLRPFYWLMMLLIIIIYFFILYPEELCSVQFKIATENNTIFAKIFPKDEGLLTVKGVDNDYESTVTTEEFINRFNPIPYVKKDSLKSSLRDYTFIAMMLITVGVFPFVFYEMNDIFKRRKFSRLLNLDKSLSQKKSNKRINADRKS